MTDSEDLSAKFDSADRSATGDGGWSTRIEHSDDWDELEEIRTERDALRDENHDLREQLRQARIPTQQ
jgi:hypothetical protein